MARRQTPPGTQKIRRQEQESEDQAVKPMPALPSPLASDSPIKEVLQSSPAPPEVSSLEWTQKSSTDPRSEENEKPHFPNWHESTRNLDRKRKRSDNVEDLASQAQDEPIEGRTRVSSPARQVQNEPIGKRARISSSDFIAVSNEETHSIDSENRIEYWTKTGGWPKKLFQPDPNMSHPLTKKRSSSAMSYSQGVKEGQYPPAHTPLYEKQILEPAGIMMYQEEGEAAISDDSEKLCTTLVQATYEPPQNSLFEGDLYMKVINCVRSRNEARIVRDVSPWLVPSAELLFMSGVLKQKDLIEEIQAEWSKCAPVAGPLARPDFTVGLQSSAFTEDELKKLRYHSTPDKPTLFAGDLFFPFLICEVKCGENGLNIADRQNARSAAIAVNAILQLHPVSSRAQQLHRKILIFSISHDHDRVKIYGHYALIREDRTTFHRHLVHDISLAAYKGRNRWASYHFVRKLYDHFAPIHLKRIKDAISQLRGPTSESIMSTDTTERESETTDSQARVVNAPASQSQDSETFKKPALPLKKQRQNKDTETAVLQQMAMLQEENDRQRQENERQRQEFERKIQVSKQEAEEQYQQLHAMIALLRQDLTQQRQRQEN